MDILRHTVTVAKRTPFPESLRVSSQLVTDFCFLIDSKTKAFTFISASFAISGRFLALSCGLVSFSLYLYVDRYRHRQSQDLVMLKVGFFCPNVTQSQDLAMLT